MLRVLRQYDGFLDVALVDLHARVLHAVRGRPRQLDALRRLL
jgi:hypothetical protein